MMGELIGRQTTRGMVVNGIRGMSDCVIMYNWVHTSNDASYCDGWNGLAGEESLRVCAVVSML